MPQYRRKPIIAIPDGDNYKITDGLGNISIMQKKQFEALFERIGNNKDVISDIEDDVDKKERKKNRR